MCFLQYTKSSNEKLFLFSDNRVRFRKHECKRYLVFWFQYKFKIMDVDNREYRHVFLGPAHGCYGESSIIQIDVSKIHLVRKRHLKI